MRYDNEQKARTRERILQEAAAAIREHGVEGVSVAALMARAGLTHGGFYAHFASKDELVAEAVNQMFEGRYAYFLSHIDKADPREALTSYIEHYLSMGHRDHPERGCPLPVLAGDFSRLPEGAQERFEKGMSRLTTAMATLLEHMGDKQAESHAATTLAQMVGAVSLARAHSNKRSAKALLDDTRESVMSKLGLQAA